MNLRNPINTLSHALLHAIELGLNGVPSEAATRLLGPTENGPRRRRPVLSECEVVMFCQTWQPDEMGFNDCNGGKHVEGEVVIVIGPQRDACVYFACQFAYHLASPNRAFFLDVAAQSMAPIHRSGRYDGPDGEEVESIEYCIEMHMSRLHAVMSQSPARARAIAELLRGYADKFAGLASNAEERIAAADSVVER